MRPPQDPRAHARYLAFRSVRSLLRLPPPPIPSADAGPWADPSRALGADGMSNLSLCSEISCDSEVRDDWESCNNVNNVESAAAASKASTGIWPATATLQPPLNREQPAIAPPAAMPFVVAERTDAGVSHSTPQLTAIVILPGSALDLDSGDVAAMIAAPDPGAGCLRLPCDWLEASASLHARVDDVERERECTSAARTVADVPSTARSHNSDAMPHAEGLVLSKSSADALASPIRLLVCSDAKVKDTLSATAECYRDWKGPHSFNQIDRMVPSSSPIWDGGGEHPEAFESDSEEMDEISKIGEQVRANLKLLVAFSFICGAGPSPLLHHCDTV